MPPAAPSRTARRGRRRATPAAALAAVVALAGCSGAPGAATTTPTTADGAPATEPTTTEPATTGPTTTAPTTTETAAGPTPTAPPLGEGTVVRFSGAATSVDVVMGPDTPTTLDLLARLPLTLTLEEFAGREKIGYPEGGLDVEGTPGSDPEDGDLIYFTPWGNLGLYDDADGIGYSDDTPHLGTYQASEEQLAQLEGEVVLEVVTP